MSQRYIWIAAGVCLLGSSGCLTQSYCNGTGEPLLFGYGFDSTSAALENEHQIEPCACATVIFPRGDPRAVVGIATVRDLSGNLLVQESFIGTDQTLTYDGFELLESNQFADLSVKSTITFRNESLTAVHMKPSAAATRPQTLVNPGDARAIVTIRTGSADFEVAGDDGTSLATCTAEIVDGLEIVWDGTDLTCDVAPPPPPPATEVDIDLCNDDTQTNAVAVILVTADEEVLPEKNVIPGECRTVSVPTGGPVTFEAWDNEAVIMLDECTLDDPGAGDHVTWDGFVLACVDVASAATALEPIPDPLPEADPFDEVAVEALRLGNDLTRSARRQFRSLIDGVNPF